MFGTMEDMDMLINEAKKRNMEIIEVESLMFQYNMFSSFSPELQELLLKYHHVD